MSSPDFSPLLTLTYAPHHRFPDGDDAEHAELDNAWLLWDSQFNSTKILINEAAK